MKALKIIRNIFVWLVVAIAVLMMIFTIVSVSTFDRTDRSIFGYKTFIVLSDSMSKTDFSAGDLILVKETDPSALKEGDIISYISQNSANFGETVTHKIRRRTVDANGEPGFITYGTTTDTNDETVVTYAYVIGKYTGRIPKMGSFFNFLKSTPGYIVCILLPFLILIVCEGINCVRLFRKYKSEQQAELQAERDKLQADREETQKMMQELQRLKEQLAQGKTEAYEAASAGDIKAESECRRESTECCAADNASNDDTSAGNAAAENTSADNASNDDNAVGGEKAADAASKRRRRETL